MSEMSAYDVTPIHRRANVRVFAMSKLIHTPAEATREVLRSHWLAHAYLTPRGWANSADIQRLAAQLQDCCQDFEADLANEYEREGRHEL